MGRMSRDERLAQAEECLASGMTVKDWCAANGVPAATMYVWVRRLREERECALAPAFVELRFHPDSYGFRPGRSAHDALMAVKRHADGGCVWVASMDLERFFDTVNQSRLVQLLSDALADRWVVSLVHRFLMAGVAVDGIMEETGEGTPQGGPLSPLLANVLLNELDWELERRGYALVRYADDFVIMKPAARRPSAPWPR